ncbi:MAG: CRISPR-associated protein Cas4 [Pyrinomonadaceae bacterium]|nr:CRISPR-associated protein Cas4 [Pyrinomonadaceae bacterium]MDW8305429.1 CRISPR-associated protein Cas4 [Acidobacteriota bacterium]
MKVELEIVQVSSLSHYAFCPRRCALMNIEGVWADNEHTILGSILHQRVNEIEYETEKGAKIVRSLPIFSVKYGLNGRADVVEFRKNEIIPVEYKKGKRRKHENDEIQLCAQSLCLEEMFNTRIKRGFVYYASSKKRREVFMDEELRRMTIETIEKVRELLQKQFIPQAKYIPKRCEECSLVNICLPKLSDPNQRQHIELENFQGED